MVEGELGRRRWKDALLTWSCSRLSAQQSPRQTCPRRILPHTSQLQPLSAVPPYQITFAASSKLLTFLRQQVTPRPSTSSHDRTRFIPTGRLPAGCLRRPDPGPQIRLAL